MPNPNQNIRAVMATARTGTAWQALELTLTAAKEAGERAITANPRLPPSEPLALALRAADEALEGIGATPTAGQGEGERWTSRGAVPYRYERGTQPRREGRDLPCSRRFWSPWT
jgi:hypothetical protein